MGADILSGVVYEQILEKSDMIWISYDELHLAMRGLSAQNQDTLIISCILFHIEIDAKPIILTGRRRLLVLRCVG
jgi:hypothetical protein